MNHWKVTVRTGTTEHDYEFKSYRFSCGSFAAAAGQATKLARSSGPTAIVTAVEMIR